MTFLHRDDRIIIMDLEANRLTLDELKRIADIGIQTTYYHEAINWQKMQPTEDSPIDFGRLDEYIENIQKVGMKTLLPFLHRLPTWKPDKWYFTREKEGIPSYGNPQVGDDLDEFAKQIISRYDPQLFQLIYAIPGDGEFPCHFWPTAPDLPFPTRVLSDFVIERQRLLAQQHGEVWTAYHCYTEPVWWDSFYTALRTAYPVSQFYGIAFTLYIHNQGRIYDWYRRTSERYNMGYFGGSEYCQGLAKHTPICISQGHRGFITAPIHPFQEHKRLESWMLEDLMFANERLKEAANA